MFIFSYAYLTPLSIWGGSSTGYTYLYDSDGVVLGFSDAWFDGRYYNDHEHFQKGTKFADKPKAAIAIKDPKIELPDNGRTYMCDLWNNPKPVIESPKYDPATKTWKGIVIYYYSTKENAWVPSLPMEFFYYDENHNYVAGSDDPALIETLKLTVDDVREMRVDRNTNTDPASFKIYDMQSPPGTQGYN